MKNLVWNFKIILFIGIMLVAAGNKAQAEKKMPDLTLYTAEIPGFMGGQDPDPGMLVEMVTLAAAKFGYKIIHKVVPWARAMKLTMTSENALIPGFSRIPTREHNYTWIVRQAELDSAFISYKSKVNSFEEAMRLGSIGVHRATSHEVELEEKGFVNIRSFNNMPKSIRFLELGRIDAWYGVVNEFTRRWRLHAVDRDRKLIIGKPQLVEQVWLAGSKKLSPQIIEDLSHGTRLIIEEGHRKKLLKKYFARY